MCAKTGSGYPSLFASGKPDTKWILWSLLQATSVYSLLIAFFSDMSLKEGTKVNVLVSMVIDFEIYGFKNSRTYQSLPGIPI
jgi:hypothetical protein